MIKKFISMISKALDGLFRNKKSVTIVEDYEQRVTEEGAVSEEVKAWKKDIQIEQSVIDEVKLFGEIVEDLGFTKNEMRLIARNQGGEYRYSGKLQLGFIHYN